MPPTISLEDANLEESPPKTLQYLIHILKRAKDYTVYSKTLWAKILFLIEVEGKIKLDMPIRMDNYGPYPRAAVDYAVDNNLVRETRKPSFSHDYIEVSLTNQGDQFYNVRCLPLMEEKEIVKADKVISKYITQDYRSVVEKIYGEYVNPFKGESISKKIGKFNGLEGRVRLISANINSKLSKFASEPDAEEYSVLGKLQHILRILRAVDKSEDPVELSVVYNSISNIACLLEEMGYRYDSAFDEEFEFIDHYASTHKIYKSIGDDNLSDIGEGELKLMSQITNQVLQHRAT